VLLTLFIGIVLEAMEEAKNADSDNHADRERLERRVAVLGIQVLEQTYDILR
jgi:hypothetical protein